MFLEIFNEMEINSLLHHLLKTLLTPVANLSINEAGTIYRLYLLYAVSNCFYDHRLLQPTMCLLAVDILFVIIIV